MKTLTRNFGLLVLLCLTMAAFMVVGCGSDESAETTTETQANNPATESFSPAHFTAMDITGDERHSSEWIGRTPVVLNFWGTWCPPCRKEIPELVKLYDEYKSRLEMVSLAVRDTPSKVESFTSSANMNWVMLMAEVDILQKYNVSVGIPTTIFLNKDGKEVARFVGPRSYEAFKQAAEAALKSA